MTPKVGPERDHVYHLYVVRTKKRDALREYLTDAGVATLLNYPKALPFYPAYAYLEHKPGDFPIAYRNQARILSLPIYPEITDAMIEYVVGRIKKAFDHVSRGGSITRAKQSVSNRNTNGRTKSKVVAISLPKRSAEMSAVVHNVAKTMDTKV